MALGLESQHSFCFSSPQQLAVARTHNHAGFWSEGSYAALGIEMDSISRMERVVFNHAQRIGREFLVERRYLHEGSQVVPKPREKLVCSVCAQLAAFREPEHCRGEFDYGQE